MTKSMAERFVASELYQLGIPKSDPVYQLVFENAVEAAEILTKSEISKLIEEDLGCRGAI